MYRAMLRAHPVLAVLITAALFVAVFTVGWDRVCAAPEVIQLTVY